jgi:hypothetical protein
LNHNRTLNGAFCTALVTVLAAVASLAIRLAHATEGGGSSYPIGVATILPGIEPTPPGLNILDYNGYYSADKSLNSNGQSVVKGFQLQTVAVAPRIDYTFQPALLPWGLSYGIQIIQPFLHIDLRRDLPSGAQFHAQTSANGDTNLVPLVLGLRGSAGIGDYSQKLKFTIIVPDGQYSKTDAVNAGRNYWSFHPAYGFELYPKHGFSLGAVGTLIFNNENNATHYKSGNEFVLEYSAGYSVVPDLNLEINGYYYQQISGDRLANQEFQDGHVGRAVAIGPQIRYITGFGSAVVKWQHEMAVVDRTEGDRFWLQMLWRT